MFDNLSPERKQLLQSLAIGFVVLLVLSALYWFTYHAADDKKDSYSSYYTPQGFASGEGPMQQRWGGDPYGSQLAKHAQMDHTGAGCGCSSSLHEMASAHQSGRWGRHHNVMHKDGPPPHMMSSGHPSSSEHTVWQRRTAGEFGEAGGATPSAVGLSDESLAMAIGADGQADMF